MKVLIVIGLLLLPFMSVAQNADEILIPRYILDQANGREVSLKSDTRFEVQSFTAASLPETIVAQDFDEDGRVDLIIAAVDKYAKSGRSLMVWKYVDWSASGVPIYINCTAEFERRHEIPYQIKALLSGE
jgi:hypothetical protein